MSTPRGTAPDPDGDELARLRAEVATLRAELDQARQAAAAAPPSDDTVALDQDGAGSGAGRRPGWWRTPVVALLITVAALLAPLAIVATWARDQVGDTDRYVETVTPLATDPAVQDALVARITNEIFKRLDIKSLTQETVDALQAQGLPPRVADGLDALAVPLERGVRNFVTERVERIIKSPEFEQAWIAANREAHAQLVAVLTGKDTDTVTVTGNAVNVNLAAVIETVKAAARPSRLQPGRRPAHGQRAVHDLRVRRPDQGTERFPVPRCDRHLAAGHRVGARGARRLPRPQPASRAPRGGPGRRLRHALLGSILNIFRPIYLDAISEQGLNPEAAASVYDQLVSFIRLNLRAVLVVALAVAAGAWLSAPTGSAVTVRRGITGALGAVRGGGERVGLRTGPVGAFVYRYRTLLRVLVIGVAALVYIQAAHPTGGWTIGILVYTVIALLLVELLGRPPAAGDQPAPELTDSGMSHPSDEKSDHPAVEHREQLAVVDAGDELSAATAAALRSTVTDALAGRPRTGSERAENPNIEEQPAETAELRLLLGGVTVFDQNGLGLLVGLHREARSVGVRLVCVNPQMALFAALRQQGLHRVLTVELDVRK